MSRENLELTFAKGEAIPTEGETVRQQGLVNEYNVWIHHIRYMERHEDGTVTLAVNAVRIVVEPPVSIVDYWNLPADSQKRLRPSK